MDVVGGGATATATAGAAGGETSKNPVNVILL